MDFRTSTPLVFPKAHSSRVHPNTEDQINTKRLFVKTNDPSNNNNNANTNNNSNNYNSGVIFNEYWDKINGPKFVDFANGIPEPRDSFFDGRQSICPTPVSEEEAMQIDNGIINTLENISLGSDIGEEDITLKADTTALEQSIINYTTPNDDRRLSRLSTAPQPFSFETREKEKQERRQAKKQYLMSVSQQPPEFKARAAPKFKNVPKNPIKQIKKEEKRIFQEFIPKKEVKVIHEIKPVCRGTIKEEAISPIQFHSAATADKSVSCNSDELNNYLAPQAKNKDCAEAENKKVEVWNQKPFQVNLPKRRILVPKSPKLRTAKRAEERKLYEEKLRLRELEFEDLRRTLSESQKEKEKDEIARLRQLATFKARPMPKYPDVKVSVPFKRPLADPTVPLISKRPRLGISKNSR
ncbi:targeting protein for Xklp2-like isoform X1 [Cotesia glomerata]|uniref:targeting protein for Xklp2-like isoform X1 n=1 Tax=Cotesia glomerata TaxID=32391 RepID=UPI001D01F8D7|nr:targeting protein for Xklp2-like isoform X1 [Cotesia glomerata]